jgi:multidrug efflux system membrane fusion protein
MRSVKPGVSEGGVTQVSGINPGDVVANSSFDKLQDNVAVVLPGQPASKQPAAAKTTRSKAK